MICGLEQVEEIQSKFNLWLGIEGGNKSERCPSRHHTHLILITSSES